MEQKEPAHEGLAFRVAETESPLASARPQRNGSPAVRATSVGLPLSQQKTALPLGEDAYSALVEMSPDALFVSRDHRIVFLNPMALLLIGASSAERVLGMEQCDLFHPDCRAAMVERAARVIEGQCVPLIEGRIVRFDGGIVDVEVAASPFSDRQGTALQIILRDISKRKQMEQALSQSERGHRLLFETMLQGVTYHNPDGAIVSVNPAAERILGRSAAELLENISLSVDGDAIRDDGSPFPAAEHPPMASLRTGQEVRDITMGVYNPRDSCHRWINVHAVPMFRPGEGKPYQVYTIFDDVTERKRSEAAVREAHDELEHKVAQRTAELQRVNRMLRTISDCNQALMHATDERKLIETICRIITEASGYRMARVGFAESDRAKTVSCVASFGFDETYSKRVQVSWGDRRSGQGPTGSAIRTGQVCIGEDFLNDPTLSPWRGEALRSGFRSSIGLPLAAPGRVFGALTIYSSRPGDFNQKQADMLRELADDLAFGIMALRARIERDHATQILEQKNAQLRKLTLELTKTEARERRRLAQVLHDHLQQLLVGARFSLGVLHRSRDATRHELVRETVEHVDALLGEALESSRSLTYELSPPVLYQAGLAAALRWLGQQFQEKHHLNVGFSANPEVDVDDENVRIVVFNAVRELLFNIVKHAQVKCAQVRLDRSKDGRITVVVADKGVGFDLATVGGREGETGGFGLFSLRENLELLGGGLEIKSAPGHGSRITIHAPSHEEAAEGASKSEPGRTSKPSR